MNEEALMDLDASEPGADQETEQSVPQGDETSPNDSGEGVAEQEDGEASKAVKNENNEPTEAEPDDEPEDEYDGFYHDMSDFEQTNDDKPDEGGDTPVDPEGEDADEGENEDEEPEPEEDADPGEEDPEDEESTDTDASDGAEEQEPEEDREEKGGYSNWEAEDRAAILAAHPELETLFKDKSLGQMLDDPGLFAFMRGTAENRKKYSAVEAFEKASATLLANRAAKVQAKQNSKQHIKSGGGKAATPPSSIPAGMMGQLRQMFPGKSRAELEKLYHDVT